MRIKFLNFSNHLLNLIIKFFLIKKTDTIRTTTETTKKGGLTLTNREGEKKDRRSDNTVRKNYSHG